MGSTRAALLAGIAAAGFADRFDRKRLLLFFYLGFTAGTALCALAPNYHVLLIGRIVAGLFGGVMGSIVLAIITDLFALKLRGRVMGFVQTAFAASQVLGIPALPIASSIARQASRASGCARRLLAIEFRNRHMSARFG